MKVLIYGLPEGHVLLPCKNDSFLSLRTYSVYKWYPCTGSGRHPISVARVVVVGRASSSHITEVRGVAYVRRREPPVSRTTTASDLIQNITYISYSRLLNLPLSDFIHALIFSSSRSSNLVHSSRTESLIGRISLIKRKSFSMICISNTALC